MEQLLRSKIVGEALLMFLFAAAGFVVLKYYDWFSSGDKYRRASFGICVVEGLLGKNGAQLVYLVMTVLFSLMGVGLLLYALIENRGG